MIDESKKKEMQCRAILDQQRARLIETIGRMDSDRFGELLDEVDAMTAECSGNEKRMLICAVAGHAICDLMISSTEDEEQ